MSVKRRTSKRSSTPHTLKEQLQGSEVDQEIFGEKRDVLVIIGMNGLVVEILDALVELEIIKSRSEAFSDIVKTAIPSNHKVFISLKLEADILKRRIVDAKDMDSRVISGEIE